VSDPARERLDSLRARLILSSAVVSFHYHHEGTVGDAFAVLSEIEKRLLVD